jgi:hypothetical protein
MMLFLSRSDPLTPDPLFFMLKGREVVNSPAESPKCVGTRIGYETETPI